MRFRFDRAIRLLAVAVCGVSPVLFWGCGSTVGDRAQSAEPPIELTELTVLPAADLLYEIRDLHVGPAGDLWVLSATEPFLHHYDATHQHTGSYGRQGRGPGELQNPWSLPFAGDQPSDAVIWDAGARSLTQVGDERESGSSVVIRLNSPSVVADIGSLTYGTPLRMKRFGGGYVVQQPTNTVSASGDLSTLVLLRIDSAMRNIDTLLVLSPSASAEPGWQSTSVYATIPLWTVCASGELLVMDPFREELLWVGADGEARRTAPLRVPRREITDNEHRSYLRHVITLELRGKEGPSPALIERRIDDILDRGKHLFAQRSPPGVSLLCDHTGNAWVQEFDPGDDSVGYGRTWWMHGESDSVRGVTLPERFQPHQIVPGKAWGVYKDELDVQHPAYVEITPQVRTALGASSVEGGIPSNHRRSDYVQACHSRAHDLERDSRRLARCAAGRCGSILADMLQERRRWKRILRELLVHARLS
jgi:hypothetical protein